MSGTAADYRDDLSEMDGIDDRPLPDLLYPPDKLVRALGTIKVTLALSRASGHIFRGQVKRQGVPYRPTIRALVELGSARRHL